MALEYQPNKFDEKRIMVPRVTYSCIQFVHVIHIALAIIPIISSYIVIIITKILRRLYNMYIIGSSYEPTIKFLPSSGRIERARPSRPLSVELHAETK